MTLLYRAVSFHRPHARQPFVTTKGTQCLHCHETSHLIKQCKYPFSNANGCINPELGQPGDNGDAYRHLVSSGITATRTAAGMHACCATTAATKTGVVSRVRATVWDAKILQSTESRRRVSVVELPAEQLDKKVENHRTGISSVNEAWPKMSSMTVLRRGGRRLFCHGRKHARKLCEGCVPTP